MREVSRGNQKRLLLLRALHSLQQQRCQAAGRRGTAQPTDAHRRDGKRGPRCTAPAASSTAVAQGVLQEGQLVLQAMLQAAAGGSCHKVVCQAELGCTRQKLRAHARLCLPSPGAGTQAATVAAVAALCAHLWGMSSYGSPAAANSAFS